MNTHLIRLCRIIISCCLLPGCSSPRKPETVYVPSTQPNLPLSENSSVWVPEQFSEYSVGRYVDPHNPGVMHDAHSLYRVEQTGHWNLAPNSDPQPQVQKPVFDNVVLHDALTAELNRQRATSEALISQAKLLDEHLRELNSQSREFRDALQESSRLREQLAAVRNRLTVIEGQLGELTQSSIHK